MARTGPGQGMPRSAALERMLRSPSPPSPQNAGAAAAPAARPLAESAIARERIERVTGRPGARKTAPADEDAASTMRPPAARAANGSMQDAPGEPAGGTPKEEARRAREAARLKTLLASRTQRSPAVGWATLSGARGRSGSRQHESPSSAANQVVTARHKAEAAKQAAAAVASEEEKCTKTRDAGPLRPEELDKRAPGHDGRAQEQGAAASQRDHSSDSDDVRPARDRRGRASSRANQPVRLIPDSSDQHSSDSDDDLDAALRRTSGSAATRKSLKERAEAARRCSPRRRRSKSSSRLQFENLHKRWEDDRRMERDDRRMERETLAKSRGEWADAAVADPASRDESLRARLEQIDGMLDTVLRSSEAGPNGVTETRLVTLSLGSASGAPVSDSRTGAPDGWAAGDPRHTWLAGGERGKSSERAQSRSPGPAEKQPSKSPPQDPDWIARHTYASMMKKIRPIMPRQEEGACRNLEMLDALLQQRDETIRALKSDLLLADATREKLRANVESLEDTVDSLRQQNLQCEGQRARSVDVCQLLKDEVTKFSNELKESESALVKQGELLQTLKNDSEAKRKVEELHEASWKSQVEALESQLDIAKRARECQSQHHSQLMAELEGQIAILQEKKREDSEKFAQDFGRSAAREAELAEKNRQLKRDLEVLRLHAAEKERTGKELQESEVSILAAAVDSYEQALKELGSERDSLESQCKALATSVDSYKQALEDSGARYAALELENADLKARLEGLSKKEFVESEKLSKRIESLEQVKTVYQLTINELSESSVKANQGLSKFADRENKKLQEHIEELVRQRDEFAERLRESLTAREGEAWDRLQQAEESIGDLKKMVELLENERNSLQKARSADAVTIKVLKESCEVVQAEHQRQVSALIYHMLLSKSVSNPSVLRAQNFGMVF